MFSLVAHGKAHAPLRTALALEDGVLLSMSAASPEYAALKTVTVHAGNTARGLPQVQGEVMLMRAATGERLLLLDGAELTARRTAALSIAGLEAADAAPKAGERLHVLILGSGVQAQAHAEALLACWPVAQLSIHGRDTDAAHALLTRLRTLHPSVTLQLLSSATALQTLAAREPLVIVTATSSSTALLHGPVHAGSRIAAVGAYTPQMAEVAPTVVHQCQIVVDTLEGCRAEAGDLLQANVDWTQVQPLARPAPRQAAKPLLLKTVGSALWDLAAAQLAYTQWQAVPHSHLQPI
jgi:ornithine cyclodeaminase